jgi:hypothetical protein
MALNDVTADSDSRMTSSYKDITFNNSKMDDVLGQNFMLSLDRAIKKEQRSKKTKSGERFKKIYYKVFFLKYVALTIYIIMVLFEIPSWCLNNKNIK